MYMYIGLEALLCKYTPRFHERGSAGMSEILSFQGHQLGFVVSDFKLKSDWSLEVILTLLYYFVSKYLKKILYKSNEASPKLEIRFYESNNLTYSRSGFQSLNRFIVVSYFKILEYSDGICELVPFEKAPCDKVPRRNFLKKVPLKEFPG